MTTPTNPQCHCGTERIAASLVPTFTTAPSDDYTDHVPEPESNVEAAVGGVSIWAGLLALKK